MCDIDSAKEVVQKKDLFVENPESLMLSNKSTKTSTMITGDYFFFGTTGGVSLVLVSSLSKLVCKVLIAGMEFNVAGGGSAFGTDTKPTEVLIWLGATTGVGAGLSGGVAGIRIS